MSERKLIPLRTAREARAAPVIRTCCLSVHYAGKTALRDVELEIAEGAVTAVIGPSGCGKSSFLASLNRLTDLVPGCTVTGAVRFDGQDVTESSCDVVALRRRVGMIFQKPNPFALSIRRNLEMPLREIGVRSRSERRVLAEQALHDVGLWNEVKDRLDHPALELSGGQQQRLCIARALALGPKVLLLDEPCSALDPIASGVVEDLIASLRGRVTLVVVTHNLAQARRIADDTAVFWVRDGAGGDDRGRPDRAGVRTAPGARDPGLRGGCPRLGLFSSSALRDREAGVRIRSRRGAATVSACGSRGEAMGEDKGLDRRAFLRGSAAAGVSVSLLPLAARAKPDPPRVRRRVTLGRTGIEMPDIGFGASRLSGDEALVHHALDRGIDYFDTADRYTMGSSEETLGRALAGKRDAVTIASKTKCGARDGVQDLFEALEASLRRLRTDRIDIYFNHAVNDVDRLRNDAWGEFVEKAKGQGKIRYTGISGHGGRLAECLDYALDHELVDVFLVGHNFGQDPAFYERLTASMDFVAIQPELPRLMAKAKQKGVGVIAMKTLRGARLNDLTAYEREGGTFAQAAFRWVLTGSNVDALVVTMKSPAMIDEYLGASGATGVSAHDLQLLARYEGLHGDSQCRYGCGACLSSCPENVAIDEVLRSRMYAADYGDLTLGREDYAGLGRGASSCLGCAHTACAGACPHGLDIPALTRDAHRRLA